MVLDELRGLTQIVHVYLKCHVLALSHTVWSRQYEETENQFPGVWSKSVNFWRENDQST